MFAVQLGSFGEDVTQRGNACSISLGLSLSMVYSPVLRSSSSIGLVAQVDGREENIQMLKLWVAEALAIAAQRPMMPPHWQMPLLLWLARYGSVVVNRLDGADLDGVRPPLCDRH
jgi:hypothetical protein